MPTVVQNVLASPGKPLDTATRSCMEARFGHDFAAVRVHADEPAADSAEAISALAYTNENQIVFARGQYAPDTQAGRQLLSHELAHVVQQSDRQMGQPGPTLSQPGDAGERSADQAASQVLSGGHADGLGGHHATAMIQRQTTAAAETTDLRQRRLAAASRLRSSISQFRGALSGGLQWNFERIVPQGNQMGIGNNTVIESMSSRQARLTQLMNDLARFMVTLESGPVPTTWLDPVKMPPSTFQGSAMGGGTIADFGRGPDWEDPLRFFSHWQLDRGSDSGALTVNQLYIPDPPQPGQVAAIPRVAIATGTSAGIWIVIPDADNRPMEYHRLRTDENWPAGNTIFEVWHDSLGYYYLNHQEKHYLPGRPEL